LNLRINDDLALNSYFISMYRALQ